MTYSKAIQEKFFQPYRLAVVEGQSGRHVRGCYWIAKVDGQKKPVAIFYRKSKTGDVVARPSRGMLADRGSFTSKTDVVRRAKELAVELSLPFDPQTDWLTQSDAELGPLNPCVGCGYVGPARDRFGYWSHRGWKSGLCEKCRSAMEVGRSQSEDVLLVKVSSCLIQNYVSGLDEEGLLRALLGAVGARYPIYDEKHSRDPDKVLLVDGVVNARKFLTVMVPVERYDLLSKLYADLAKALDLAYADGLKDGESFVASLAAGRISMDQLNERLKT